MHTINHKTLWNLKIHPWTLLPATKCESNKTHTRLSSSTRCLTISISLIFLSVQILWIWWKRTDFKNFSITAILRYLLKWCSESVSSSCSTSGTRRVNLVEIFSPLHCYPLPHTEGTLFLHISATLSLCKWLIFWSIT